MEISALDHGCYFLWPGKKISIASKIELITKLEIVKKKRKTSRSKFMPDWRYSRVTSRCRRTCRVFGAAIASAPLDLIIIVLDQSLGML